MTRDQGSVYYRKALQEFVREVESYCQHMRAVMAGAPHQDDRSAMLLNELEIALDQAKRDGLN